MQERSFAYSSLVSAQAETDVTDVHRLRDAIKALELRPTKKVVRSAMKCYYVS